MNVVETSPPLRYRLAANTLIHRRPWRRQWRETPVSLCGWDHVTGDGRVGATQAPALGRIPALTAPVASSQR